MKCTLSVYSAQRLWSNQKRKPVLYIWSWTCFGSIIYFICSFHYSDFLRYIWLHIGSYTYTSITTYWTIVVVAICTCYICLWYIHISTCSIYLLTYVSWAYIIHIISIYTIYLLLIIIDYSINMTKICHPCAYFWLFLI